MHKIWQESNNITRSVYTIRQFINWLWNFTNDWIAHNSTITKWSHFTSKILKITIIKLQTIKRVISLHFYHLYLHSLFHNLVHYNFFNNNIVILLNYYRIESQISFISSSFKNGTHNSRWMGAREYYSLDFFHNVPE